MIKRNQKIDMRNCYVFSSYVLFYVIIIYLNKLIFIIINDNSLLKFKFYKNKKIIKFKENKN